MIPKPVKDHDVLLPGPPTTFALNSVTPMPCVSLAFGRSLQDLAALEGWTLVSDPPVPRVVRQLVEHVRANGKLNVGMASIDNGVFIDYIYMTSRAQQGRHLSEITSQR
jgi:hypothetical protein